ncbi:hypothetical protein P8786_22175, partial [Bacillus subtilis]|uniref:hypothetical protein n=1 Tax=Bacillus subtilis TaxID=1423 RepID=UPI002DB58D6B
KPCPKEFHRSVALVKDYSKKMDVNYLYSNVFVFLLMSKNKKAENSVKIYATLVKQLSFIKHFKWVICLKILKPFPWCLV